VAHAARAGFFLTFPAAAGIFSSAQPPRGGFPMFTPRTRILFSILAVAALVIAGCGTREPADTRADDEAAIRANVVDWSAAAEARRADTFASYYLDDAVLMLPGRSAIRGRVAIEQTVTEMMQAPGFHLTFATDQVEVARSGDIACETGAYRFTVHDAEGNPVTEVGKYIVVWKKQAGGEWKAAYDIINADQ
jgi:uncharacterized protein (TIGR02246 family)